VVKIELVRVVARTFNYRPLALDTPHRGKVFSDATTTCFPECRGIAGVAQQAQNVLRHSLNVTFVYEQASFSVYHYFGDARVSRGDDGQSGCARFLY